MVAPPEAPANSLFADVADFNPLLNLSNFTAFTCFAKLPNLPLSWSTGTWVATI